MRWLPRARLPNDGGGPDTLAQLLLGQATQPDKAVKHEHYATGRSMLLDWQQPDGSWQAAGQLPSVKWASPAEMNEATTLWSVLALERSGDTNDRATSQRRALQSLKESKPGITLQSLALHSIVAHQLGESAREKTLAAQLLARQNPDGGWGWTTQNKTSEAFSTGQALYALGRIGHDGADPSVERAWKFLLTTQLSDGSWVVPQEAINTRPRKLNVYTYWGTAWAAIGVLQTLPK